MAQSDIMSLADDAKVTSWGRHQIFLKDFSEARQRSEGNPD